MILTISASRRRGVRSTTGAVSEPHVSTGVNPLLWYQRTSTWQSCPRLVSVSTDWCTCSHSFGLAARIVLAGTDVVRWLMLHQ